MIRGIFFDFGGTLDGGGGHWLDRFVSLYASTGLRFPRERIRQAFDHAESRANDDPDIVKADLTQMIDSHLRWQFAYLDLADENLRSEIAGKFLAPIFAAASNHQQVLAILARRNFRLGVISNGCGNADVLCAELGYSPYLSVIIDSRRVNLRKPDPAIFEHGASELGLEPESVLMVGDSFERDIRAAKNAGMQTAWLRHDPPVACPDPGIVDLILNRLSDLTTSPLLDMTTIAA